MPALGSVTLFARDIDALARFYAAVFGFARIEAFSNDIFRALDAGNALLGFSASRARELLGIPEQAEAAGTRSLITIDVTDRAEVDRLAAVAVRYGARLLKAPFETYYGAWQAVLADPEGNVFRINRMP